MITNFENLSSFSVARLFTFMGFWKLYVHNYIQFSHLILYESMDCFCVLFS
jgi:hypothetical protein